jgi:hypothetical protein
MFNIRARVRGYWEILCKELREVAIPRLDPAVGIHQHLSLHACDLTSARAIVGDKAPLRL